MKKPMNSSPRVSLDTFTQQTPQRRPRFSGDDKPAKKPAPKKKPAAKKPAAPKTKTKEESEAVAGTPKIPDHREDIQAPYHFTPAEIETMNHGLRTSLDDIETLQSQAKAAAQDFKLRITNKQNEAKQLRNKLGAGEETRPMKAAVEFIPKKSVKRYLHPETGELIREEPMQPADWQLPMFKPEEIQSPKPPAPSPEPPKSGKAPKTSPVGETSVGDALDAAAAKTKAPLFWLDLDATYPAPNNLTGEFKKTAKKAGWTLPQISALMDILKSADGIPAMIETLRPYVIAKEDHYTQVADPDGGSIQVARADVALPDGFPLEKIVGIFRKAAKAAEWPDTAIDVAVNEAERQARVIGDEPEATEAGANYLRSFTVPK